MAALIYISYDGDKKTLPEKKFKVLIYINLHRGLLTFAPPVASAGGNEGLKCMTGNWSIFALPILAILRSSRMKTLQNEISGQN